MSFGDTLAKLREAAGFTQTQLAIRANVPIDTLRRWEQGRHLPQIDAAYRLAKALGIELNRLVISSDMEAKGDDRKQPAEPEKPKRPRGRPKKGK